MCGVFCGRKYGFVCLTMQFGSLPLLCKAPQSLSLPLQCPSAPYRASSLPDASAQDSAIAVPRVAGQRRCGAEQPETQPLHRHSTPCLSLPYRCFESPRCAVPLLFSSVRHVALPSHCQSIQYTAEQNCAVASPCRAKHSVAIAIHRPSTLCRCHAKQISAILNCAVPLHSCYESYSMR